MPREIGKGLLVYDRTPGSTAHGEVVDIGQLDNLRDTNNRRHRKTCLLNWVDADEDWLSIEDEPIV